MSTSSAKKAKTNEEAELDILQQYILECPLVPKESRAIHAALKGLDQERKRMERDAKLQKKFSSAKETQNSNATTNSSTKKQSNHDTTPATSSAAVDHDDDDAALMEWQDVTTSKIGDQDDDDDGSLLGRKLAQSAIASMAQAGTFITSPLAAIGLALHAAILELGFTCTGVPPPSTQKGFAPPIRPIRTFLPPDWDKHALDEQDANVTLRYRKDHVGAVHLVVTNKDGVVEVQLTPANSKEPHPSIVTFAMEDHVNLDSLQAALAGSPKGVLPALHYKALPVLMTKFCNTFDLGFVSEEATTMTDDPIPPTATLPPQPSTANSKPSSGFDPLRVYNQHEDPSINQFQPHHGRGDFAGDLLPAGGRLVDPSSIGGELPQPGNLMGPNHPMFQSGPHLGGGLGMKPRFDPYGPPGGPTDPNFIDPNNNNGNRRGRPRPPPGGSGDPNPDHQRPPSDLNNNMFT